MEIFSRMARMGSTMIADPRFDTMSLKVYEVPVVGSVNPVNAGGLISGRPAGTGPAQKQHRRVFKFNFGFKFMRQRYIPGKEILYAGEELIKMPTYVFGLKRCDQTKTHTLAF